MTQHGVILEGMIQRYHRPDIDQPVVLQHVQRQVADDGGLVGVWTGVRLVSFMRKGESWECFHCLTNIFWSQANEAERVITRGHEA